MIPKHGYQCSDRITLRSARRPAGMALLRRLTCAVVLGTAALAMAGCDHLDGITDMFDSKKKLPGDRKPVFPEGVPGVSQGIPAELQKGYSEQAAQPGPDPATAAVQQLTAQPEKEKPRPKPVAKPKPAPRPAQQAQTAPQAPPPPPPQQPPPQQSGDAPVRHAPLPWPGTQ
jgi:hypothetical protein